MRLGLLHMVLFAIGFPLSGWAQTTNAPTEISFYVDLAFRDAQHELALPALNLEDEQDFWKDQKAFEKLLSKTNPKGYRVYLNSKSSIYRQHQIHCGNRCDHSEEFSRQISFYIINGDSSSDVAYHVEAPKVSPANKN